MSFNHCVFLVGISVVHVEELLYYSWVLPGHLLEKVGILDPFPEGCHDDCIADVCDRFLLLHEPPDEFLEIFTFLLVDLVQIPVDSRFCISSLKVVDELGAEISPEIYIVLWESREPVLYCWGQDHW